MNRRFYLLWANNKGCPLSQSQARLLVPGVYQHNQNPPLLSSEAINPKVHPGQLHTRPLPTSASADWFSWRRQMCSSWDNKPHSLSMDKQTTMLTFAHGGPQISHWAVQEKVRLRGENKLANITLRLLRAYKVGFSCMGEACKQASVGLTWKQLEQRHYHSHKTD